MLTPGTTLQHGRYRIVRRIGQGGMGAVYEGVDNNLNNKVAIKEALVSDDASLRKAFEREAQRLDRLRHPALPTVKDHFVEHGEQYLVMEYIEGENLGEMLHKQGQPFPVAQVLEWADRLLDALAYLHQEGVVHRDIKPANIKLTPRGEIILLDFGLAKGGLTRMTRAGRSLQAYTPGYAPPEQMLGQSTDERSDLYALGATLYGLLTGQAPDDATARQKYIQRGLPDILEPANQVNPQVPLYVAQALTHAMALEPQNRPASAQQMRTMLQAPPTEILTPPIPPIPSVNVNRTTVPEPPSSARGRGGEGARGRASNLNRPTSSHKGTGTSTSKSTNKQNWLIPAAITVAVLLFGVLIGGYMMSSPAEPSAAPEPTEEIVVAEPTNPPTAAAEPTTPPTIEPTTPPTIEPTTPPTIEPTTEPTPDPTDPIISDKDGMTLLNVPEGDFEMGSANNDPDAHDDEKPRHTVFLDAYSIDQTEVTNAMFAKFVEETGHETEAEKEGSGFVCVDDGEGGYDCDYIDGADWQHPQGPQSDLTGLEDHPVVQVSWDDATAYCEWAGRRLPTEAEWEKAAGGTDSRKYPWGNEAPNGDLLNFCDQNCRFDHKDSSTDDGYEFTSPVGSYPDGASPYGALDMSGNVWEWVNDTYDENYYDTSPDANPNNESPQGPKVLRGGSWNDTARNTRARRRDRGVAVDRVYLKGLSLRHLTFFSPVG